MRRQGPVLVSEEVDTQTCILCKCDILCDGKIIFGEKKVKNARAACFDGVIFLKTWLEWLLVEISDWSIVVM